MIANQRATASTYGSFGGLQMPIPEGLIDASARAQVSGIYFMGGAGGGGGGGGAVNVPAFLIHSLFFRMRRRRLNFGLRGR